MFRRVKKLTGKDERADRYGHVALSFDDGATDDGATDDGATLKGFNPVRPDDMDRERFLAELDAGASFPGQIKNDTALFAQVRRLKLEPRLVEYELDSDICLEVKRRLDHDEANSPLSGKRYSFPDKKGCGFAPDTYNCLTYPLSLGIPESLYPHGFGYLSRVPLEKDEYLVIKYKCR